MECSVDYFQIPPIFNWRQIPSRRAAIDVFGYFIGRFIARYSLAFCFAERLSFRLVNSMEDTGACWTRSLSLIPSRVLAICRE